MYFRTVWRRITGVSTPRDGAPSHICHVGGLVLLAVLAAACGEAKLGDPTTGALGGGDGVPDAAVELPDAFVAPSVDAAMPPDAPPSDAALPDAQAAATCAELYGMAPDYQLCSETADSCSFNALTDGGNCADMCAAYGGVCLTAYDNNNTDVCVSQGEDTCQTNRHNEICVCSRPQ